MPVVCFHERGGQSDTSSVNGLPHVVDVDSSRDFLNQHWSNSVLSHLFVDAQEIDFGHLDCFALTYHFHWDSRNESDKFVFLIVSDSEQPILFVARWVQSPFQKLGLVVESELSTVIFNIMIS